MDQKRGWWFNPDTGEVIDVTLSTHIRAIISAPLKFGTTESAIKQTYMDCKEPLGCEGKARKIIILDVLKTTPWIRMREYEGREGYWVTVNLKSPDQIPLILNRFSLTEEQCRFDFPPS